MTVQSYKDLEVWQKSMDSVARIYALTKSFPKEELYGLTSQLRRAVVSVPSNIAEGRAKRGTREFIRFISIAYGSLAEVETQIIIAERLNYTTHDDVTPVLDQIGLIGRMLNGLRNGLEKKLSLNAESRPLNASNNPELSYSGDHHAA